MILEKYLKVCNISTDINEHLPTLKEYTEKCETVTEMGVRGIISTWAFLAGNPKKLVSYDIMHPSFYGGNLNEVYEVAKDIDFRFIQENVLNVEIEPTDLLFIDTLHTYEQLSKELELHSGKVNKYIIMHDTTTFGDKGENGLGLWYAIQEFLDKNKEWVIEARYTNNNGLTILRKVI